MLIVDAFSGSQAGRVAFRKFDELVRAAFKTVERQEHGRTEYVVRHFTRGLEVCPVVCASSSGSPPCMHGQSRGARVLTGFLV